MAMKCESCGECLFDNDDMVCKSCGVVPNEIEFGSEFNVFGPNATSKLHVWNKKKNSAGLTYGLEVLDVLCNNFQVSPLVKADAFKLLQDIHSTKSFATKQDIAILGGCCLAHAQKKASQYISLTNLAIKLNCSKKKVYQFAKVLKSYCNTFEENDTPESSKDVLEHIPNVETPGMLEASVINLLSAVDEKKTELINKTISLTKLAHSCWLVSGRSPDSVIIAAAYLCWRSLHPRGPKLSLKQFCTDYSLSYTKALPRVSELRAMLVKLGNNIPSLLSRSNITEKNILFHLNYILENSETLRNDLLPDEFTKEEIAKKEFSTFRIVKPTVKRECPVTENASTYDPDMCASDVEISDSEIATYIRSEKEVKFIKALKEKYTS